MKRNFPWMILVVFLAFVSTAYGAGVEVGIGGWLQAPNGTISYKGVSTDDDIDIKDDLDYGEETRVMGRVKIDTPLWLPNIYLVAAPMDFEGTGSKSQDFTFGDVNFSASVDFNSKVTLNQYDAALYYGIPLIKTATAGRLNIDLGLNARYVDFSAEITGRDSVTNTTVTEKESLSIVIPMVYAAVQLKPMDRFAIEAEARAISVSGNSLYSVIGRLRVKVFGPAFVAGGYRYESLNIDEEDVKVDARFAGPFVEVGMKF